MSSFIRFQTFLLLVLFSISSSCQTAYEESVKEESNPKKLQQGIEILLNSYHQKGNFNGVVCVMQGEQILFEQALGYADGARSMPLTPQHRFGIGSIYKEFPATVIMQLHEKKLLTLDDKVSQYLSDFPDWADSITIRQLMQYSSGLPKINWGALFSSGEVPDDAILTNYIKAINDLEFAPGSDYLYSNCNPILLIKIVEQITQQAFPDYLVEHIFEPFNLSHTLLKDAYPFTDRELMAIPFGTDFQEDQFRMAVKSLLFMSTAEDLAKWFNALDGYQVVSKKSVATLSKSFQNDANYQSPLGNCNWENGEIVEHRHHGSSGNYECLVQHFNVDNLTIALVTNQKHGNLDEILSNIYKLSKSIKSQ